MKRFIILLSIQFFINPAYSQNNVTIAGKVINTELEFINIIAPINDISCWSFKKHQISLNEGGDFVSSFLTSSPGFYYMYDGESLITTLFLDAGDSCYVILDDKKNNVDYSGNCNYRGQKVFNDIIKEQNHLRLFGKNQFQEFNVAQIKDTILNLKRADLNKLKSLRDSANINDLFYNTVSNEITYKYGSIYYDIVSSKIFMSTLSKDNPKFIDVSDEDQKLADTTLSQLFSFFKLKGNTVNEFSYGKTNSNFFDIQKNSMIYTNTYFEFIDQFIHYKGYYFPQRNKSFKLSEVEKDFNLYNLNLYSRYLQGKDFEYAVGAYFSLWLNPLSYKAFTSGIIKPYYNYRKYFPSGPFIPTIDSFVQKYQEFNNISIKDTISGITFIDYSDTIKSLRSLVNQFKGSMLYIDIWATTCGPCLYEFKYYPDFYRFASVNDINVIFISLDRKKNEKLWRKTIINYNLIGYHLLANAGLQKDIKRTYPKMPGIPWYIIVDKEGNLSDEFIYRPSFKEKLYDQFSKYINK